MLETMKYVRKPFYIDAVQVSSANIADVAAWSQGEVRTDTEGQYVKVRVHRPLNDRQTKAYVGDWVLFAGTGYKVYTPKAFANSFEQASVETTMHHTSPTADQVDVTVTEVIETTTKAKPKPRPRKPAQVAVPNTPPVPETVVVEEPAPAESVV